MSLTAHSDEIPDDLTPSALFVLRVLVENEAMTTAQLRDDTLLNERTLRLAINHLREADLVESVPDATGPRRKKHVATLGR